MLQESVISSFMKKDCPTANLVLSVKPSSRRITAQEKQRLPAYCELVEPLNHIGIDEFPSSVQRQALICMEGQIYMFVLMLGLALNRTISKTDQCQSCC